ncbi:MAG: hypothetical protein ACRDKW_15225, partial [Actinomycetota bacterium]
MPGRPVNIGYLVNELTAAGVPVMGARNGTWQQLVREAPPNVPARALGISPLTAMKHAARAGTDWLRYAGLQTPAGSNGRRPGPMTSRRTLRVRNASRTSTPLLVVLLLTACAGGRTGSGPTPTATTS